MLEDNHITPEKPAQLPPHLKHDYGGGDTVMSWQRVWKRRLTQLKTRSGRRKFLNSQFTRAKILRNASLALLFMVVSGTLFTGLLFVWYARDLPEPDRVVRRDGFATKITDRNGELLYEVFADQQRTAITLDQVSEPLKQATIAIEDKDFYTHQGFDPTSLFRIAKNVITKRRLIGGSTLTQQLVKNVLLSSERTLPRKIKEFILAIQIESKYSKDEILQMYLNEVPYGGTAWGVATASQTFFAKEPKDLDLVESAILAGIPQRPSYYSPFTGSKTAYIGRAKDVLRRMREDQYISADEEASAAASLETVEFSQGLTKIKAPHFVLFVKKQLIELYGEDLVEQGGLKVTTSLDYELHQAAQKIVTEEIEKVASAGIGNGAAMVMDPKTGEIWSMVGSKDFFAKDYDGQVNVTQSLRQPGSAIKPLTYLVGFQRGYTPATMLMDVPTEFPSGAGNVYSPGNYDGTFRGPVQLRFALGSSLNVHAVKLLALVGIEDMLQTAYDMGLSTLEPTQENMKRFGLAVTLGGGEVRLTELVSAYSAFANGGSRVDPVSILKVEDRNGKVLFEHKPVPGKRVIQEEHTFLINHVLSDNNARLLTFGANSLLNIGGGRVAVKTGTTNDRRDNWTIGWSRGGIVGVWVGNNDNSAMKSVASGTTGASPIWNRIMREVLKKIPAEDWPIPSNVEAVLVDTVSGYPEHDGFPARSEYIVRGTLPTLPDPVHTRLKLCRGQNKLATALDVSRNEFEEKEYFVFKEDFAQTGVKSWQSSIDSWISTHGDEKYRPPTEYCGSVDEVSVELESPDNEQNFSGTEVPVRIRVTTHSEIDAVELYVNGNKRETLKERPYEVTLVLSPGKYVLRAKAIRKDGKTGESSERKIGVGGVSWNQGETTPTPTQAPAQPSPTVTLPAVIPTDKKDES
jgi:penicillin-binding protein 1C